VLLLELQIFVVESVDAVDHGLNQLNFGISQAVLVGNVVGDSGLSARLAAGSSGLKVEGFATLLQGGDALLGPAGQVNVDRGPHAGAKVGGAGVEETETGVEHKLASGLGLSSR